MAETVRIPVEFTLIRPFTQRGMKLSIEEHQRPSKKGEPIQLPEGCIHFFFEETDDDGRLETLKKTCVRRADGHCGFLCHHHDQLLMGNEGVKPQRRHESPDDKVVREILELESKEIGAHANHKVRALEHGAISIKIWDGPNPPAIKDYSKIDTIIESLDLFATS